jgi:N-methylhydantoinase A
VGVVFRVSVDVGGTFTDLVALDEETGRIINIKTASIPRTPEVGVFNAFSRFLKDHEPDSVKMIGHATTIATNALFGQVDLELPLTALITTRGFKDVIEIGRQRRAEVYNLFFQRPPMLVERRHRYEVDERVDHKGKTVVALNEDDLKEIIEDIQRKEIKTIAIGYLNSYANPSHEIRSKELVEKALPDIYVTASNEISNEYREYERFSTVVVNAALMPVIYTYISHLVEGIKDRGIQAPLYVMQSNGGMAKSNVVSDKPATIVESGPASGVIASAWLGDQVGVRNVISFDMGGTTAKAGTVRGQIPEVVSEYEVAGKIHMGRLIKGSGYPVRLPFIDLAECSAGGGTIATTVNGSLMVGPISAGALPGPACYGKGGIEPTITDANLILGRLNPENLLSGDMDIYPELAKEAFSVLARSINLSVVEVAMSVVRIANSMMAKILRIVSVERGYDPRNFTLVAFGGAGPMHACALAEELEIEKIIVPLNPGMFSALGLLTADLFHDYSKPILQEIKNIDVWDLEKAFMEMEVEGKETLYKEGILESLQKSQRSLDMRYKGQSFELNIKVSSIGTEYFLVESIEKFHEKHREIYGYSAEDEPVEIVNAKLRVIGLLEKPRLKKIENTSSPYSVRERKVYFELIEEWLDTPVIERSKFHGELEGPAVIEQYDSTTVIYPDWKLEHDRYGNLILSRDT